MYSKVYKTYKRIILSIILVTYGFISQAQQIAISRIDLMPDFPQPYLMRDWKQVAQGYDSLVFDENLIGEYLPLVFFRETNENYPNHSSFGLHTAIGTSDPNSGEAINLIPAVVGASLVGINKSNQFGQNWALMCEEYFNKRSEENIYLNHPVTNSGDDWWYETMPNIFFLQLNYLYPHLGEFDYQVETLADQWLTASALMGGSKTPWSAPHMNYRAWSMSKMSPLEQGVKEPESAGAIAWILYNAYIITGNREYLTGAEWSLEYLNSYEGNPSYELQLPYGVYAAARLNAEIGTDYDIEKMVNWVFNRGELRGWGTIVGKWGDYDCSGLIGEANDAGNDYAFAMNGFEHAGALVPMVRYDDRFATAIAKWILNLANASRLFYSKYLPDDMQDNENWTNTYDPNSYIAYESMKETKNSKSPYATGDAMTGGWAATNLMLYSSSHVGIFGGIIDTTNIEGILKLDLLCTDYYKSDAYPTYLYYNPYDVSKSIAAKLPSGSYDLYDAISNTTLVSDVSGNTNMTITAKQAMMLVQIPTGTTITKLGKKSYAGDIIIDFNNGNTVSDYPPRIKALAAIDSVFVVNTPFNIYCSASDPEQEMLQYEWTIEGVNYDSSNVFHYAGSSTSGILDIQCKVSDPAGLWDTLSIKINVVEKKMLAPEILKMEASTRKADLSETITISCLAQDANNDPLSYEWSTIYGDIVAEGNSASYTSSGIEGNYYIVCSVRDTDGMTDIDSIEVMIRDLSVPPSGNMVAHYPMNGNARDASGNGLHGTADGVSWIADIEGTAAFAAHFDGLTDNIQITNNEVLNFQEAISLAFWIYIDEFTGSEQYPISHGNWENRYKISISNNKIRFTLKTSTTIKDLDSENEAFTGQWLHLVTVYDGKDMEIWLDGKLDAFTFCSGLINKTTYNLDFGQSLPDVNGYNFHGALDAVSIYDYALSEEQILDHMKNSINIVSAPGNTIRREEIKMYPNPTSGEINILFSSPRQDFRVVIKNILGETIVSSHYSNLQNAQLEVPGPSGLYIIEVHSQEELSNVFKIMKN